MGFWDNIGAAIGSRLAQYLFPDERIFDSAHRTRLRKMDVLRSYDRGEHRKTLKVKALQADDNITLNFVGLTLERGISMLVGGGVQFDLPGEEETDQEGYLKQVWKKNKQGILLHKLAQHGGIYGTGYVKILPGAYPLDDSEVGMPRLVPIDPMWMTINTDPEDMENVRAYEARFNIIGPDGKEWARKETTERIFGVIQEPMVDDNGKPVIGADGKQKIEELPTDEVIAWIIKNYWSSPATGGKWEEYRDPVLWEYTFPPILHWQNLTNAEGVYGKSDIEDIIELQDRINWIASNISKIIRYHAHPKTWGRGSGQRSRMRWGADDIVWLPSDQAMVQNLEMQTDLESSMGFLLALRQSLFDIGRTVDLTSLADKLGALTNFGLRVLYQDALAKLGTKRELYSDALVELNHRILRLAGYEGEDADGGSVIWSEALPADRREETEVLQRDLDMGLVSKKTASAKRGYDWEQETLRQDEEAESENTLGAQLIRAFNQGR